MTAYIETVTVDSADAYRLSEWWKQVLGYVDVPGDPNEPSHEECVIVSPENGQKVLFIRVPDTKTVKNRLHLDLRPAGEATREQELERLLGLGARQLADHRKPDGQGWVVLADPEGNEFCILRSESEIAAWQRAREGVGGTS